jgi:renalase
MRRIGVIGAGPTGALVAAALRTAAPGAHVLVLDKGTRPGGRFTTTGVRPGAVAPLGGQADSGAQYVTELSPVCAPHIAELVGAGVLQPLAAAAVQHERKALPNYVAPAGVAAVPSYYLAKSGAEVHQGVRVTGLTRAAAEPNAAAAATWTATADDGRTFADLDAVVVTIPVPQVLQLGGDVPAALAGTPGLVDALRAVQYSARFVVMAYFSPHAKPALDAALPHVGRYVQPDECGVIRYVSYDSAKRAAGGGGSSPGSTPPPPPQQQQQLLSVVVHTSVGFGSQHLEEDKDAVVPGIMERLHALLPGLPPPVATRGHKWRYSQVTAPTAPPFAGAVRVAAGGDPPLVLAGDGFTASHFDGCVASAEAAVRALLLGGK